MIMYRLYVDKHNVLRMVMGIARNNSNVVRGVDISNMTIDGIRVTEDLLGMFTGHGNFNEKRNKVIFTDKTM